MITTEKHTDLVYDVGMHKGEDTEFYLRKGFRVVAMEANPDLVATCRLRFSADIRSGRLTIIEGAICGSSGKDGGNKRVAFHMNEQMSVWGTVRGDWAERNAKFGATSTCIEVDVIDFAEMLRQYGIPHYLKIDIEGCDMVCVEALRNFALRPDYVSLESDKTSMRRVRREVEVLTGLGYDCFQAVEQSSIPETQTPPMQATEGCYVAQRFVYGASGLFGTELGPGWKTRKEILRKYRVIVMGYRLLGDSGVLNRVKFPAARTVRKVMAWMLSRVTHGVVPGWYDTHARHCSVSNGLRGKALAAGEIR